MAKLFSLSTKDWLSGVGTSAHNISGGLFVNAKGINPVSDAIAVDNVNTGLLTIQADPTDKTGAVVVDTIWAGISDVTASNTGFIYMLGAGGHFYKYSMTADTVTDLRSGTQISNPANGVAIYQPQGGTKLLYYWQQTQIGTWDLSGSYPTGWTDNVYTGLQSTNYHPTHRFLDRVYYGNKDRIGSLSDDGAAGVTHSTNDLNFSTNTLVKCLEDDGFYLIIGATTNKGDNTLFAETTVYFWDTNSSSWDREWKIPEPSINAIKKGDGNILYAFCPRGVYAFSFSSPPQKIRTLGSSNSVSFDYSGAVTRFGDSVVWGGSGQAQMIGKLAPELPFAYYEPFVGTGTISFISGPTTYNKFLMATAQPKLYLFTWGTGTSSADYVAETGYIPLGDTYDISRIEVVFGEPLASGDEINIDVASDEDTMASDWGTISHTLHGAVRKVSLYKKKTGESMQLFINFLGGTPKIKTINVYGERVNK